MGSTPTPVRWLTTGAPMRWAIAASPSPQASAPEPIQISGRFAPASRAAAWSIATASGAGAERAAASTEAPPAGLRSTSAGSSTPAGARPEASAAKASCITPATSPASFAMPWLRVSPSRIADWSGSSCSSPPPRPMAFETICPITASTGACTA